MDGLVSEASEIDAYGEAAWSWHLDAGVKFAEIVSGRRGLESPNPGESAE
jgi:hypothetical protein